LVVILSEAKDDNRTYLVRPSPTRKNPGSEIGAWPVIGALPTNERAAARSRSSETPNVTRYVPTFGN
jgi:hypothetical protein